MTEEERERVAATLRRIREEVAERGLRERSPTELLPPPRNVREPEAVPREAEPSASPPPAAPDAGPVNALWPARPGGEGPGFGGALARFVRRLLGPTLQAQVAFNSKQVQLDNEILAYMEARFAETHRHYDHVLGIHGRHMQDVDERHLILQEELVAHVHDLVRRIDLVLSESERGRLGLEHGLRDLRQRLARLEEQLKHR